MALNNRATYFVAFLLLAAMFFAAFFSLKQDSLTFDELAHIPAGYSYLTEKDYRLNPEHPPLVKDLAAIPLLFLDLNFPSNDTNWTQDDGPPPWWKQFNIGTEFLYRSGNNPQQIIFWARLPMLGLTILLGLFLFLWAKKYMGNWAGLGVLALFTFSPTFLAHGRLVATDIGAAFGVTIAMYYWLEFLKNPASKPKFIATTIAFGVAMLLKFTVAMLIPFFGVITILYVLLHSPSHKIKQLVKYSVLSIVVGLAALVFIIAPVYQFHIWNYPPERQVRDTISDMAPGNIQPYEEILAINPADSPILRPFAQYFRGVLMATQRGQFGNTTYFNDNIKAGAFLAYFPTIYLTKVPLALHALSILALAGIFWSLKTKLYRGLFRGITDWTKENFTIVALGLFILAYWFIALMGSLNIGIRHLLVIFPLLYILIMWGTKGFITKIPTRKAKRATIILVTVLFILYAGSSIAAFPHYIPYYNELAGGTQNGYKIAVDSNYDWGQDFGRLVLFIEENNIQKIHLDYFGGENPEYWLGDTYVRLNPREIARDLSKGLALSEAGGGVEGWIAISLNQLMGGIAKPVKEFDQETGFYNWILDYEPVARAGNSIFIYKID